MHLPWAYRSLARPSSALEPSHPPEGILTRVHLTLSSERLIYACIYTISLQLSLLQPLHPSPETLLSRCTNNGLAGIRTQGLRLAKATISQLIYKPIEDPTLRIYLVYLGSDSFSISDRLVVMDFVSILLRR